MLGQIEVALIKPESWRGTMHYQLLHDLNHCGHTIPKGYVTDGATVPRPLWSIFPPVGLYFEASTLHDWLLDNDYGWSYANMKFKESLEQLNIKPWRIFLLHTSVCLYGKMKVAVFKEKP
ncbi:hypothetical protein GR7B_00158 [Vibrio phage vB_VcorM_GR7B]|nr:hypothetical protein GR7B_00158 [Vibrio phage vB_VcorM_GR7B]